MKYALLEKYVKLGAIEYVPFNTLSFILIPFNGDKQAQTL
jgi:hypothetical protein